MRIGAIVQWWLDVLASVGSAWREARRARRGVTVSRSAGHLVVRKMAPASAATGHAAQPVMVSVAAGTPAPAEVLRSARGGLVVFELPSADVAVRRLSVPAAARDALPGIVRSQIERLSPGRIGDVAYAFDVMPNADAAADLDVRVSIASRRVVDAARNDLAAIGLSLDRIVTRSSDAPTGAVTLWSLAEHAPDVAARVRRRLGLGIAAAVIASAALSGWALTSTRALRAERDDMRTRVEAVQQRIATFTPQERMWHAKETSPTAVTVLEALSRALPDAAYLTELRLDHASLRMIGRAKDAPALVASLQQSGGLADMQLSTPAPHNGDAAQFQIEARIEPRAAESRP